MRSFEQRRTELTATLLHAAGNVTYGDAERVPIGQLFDYLGRYLELVAQMRYQKDQGDAAGALVTYGAATDLMHAHLVPAADALDAANRTFLDHRYDEQQAESEGAGRIAGGVGALVVAALLATQLYLYRRTRRIFNVALLVATVVAGAFTRRPRRPDRRRPRRPQGSRRRTRSTPSTRSSRPARSRGTPTATRRAGCSAAPARRSSTRRTATRSGSSRASQSPRRRRSPAASVPAQYQGLFADELRNITFAGEREAAQKMIRAFAKYDAIDGKMRKLEGDHKHDAAVELCIGSGADESNAAFDEFADALKKVVLINHVAFDFTVNRGLYDLAFTEKLLPFASIAIALLAFFGVRARLKEYTRVTSPSPLEQVDLLLAAWDERLRRSRREPGRARERGHLPGARGQGRSPRRARGRDARGRLPGARRGSRRCSRTGTRLTAVIATAKEVRATISALTFWDRDEKIGEVLRLLRGRSSRARPTAWSRSASAACSTRASRTSASTRSSSAPRW